MKNVRSASGRIMVISLFVIIGLIGCAKKTNTASQSLDSNPNQVKETPRAMENAPSGNPPLIHEQSIDHGTTRPESKITLKDIYFNLDQSAIREDMKDILENDAALLKTQRTLKVQIGGYCDERGTSEYNLALGNQRAYAVKTVLMVEGVDGGRISTISYGKERPVCKEHNEECYRRNRRVHFNLK